MKYVKNLWGLVMMLAVAAGCSSKAVVEPIATHNHAALTQARLKVRLNPIATQKARHQ